MTSTLSPCRLLPPHCTRYPGSPALPKMSSLAKGKSHEGYSSDSESRRAASTQPGAKRRPSRAGTRSVTTLTAAQLERKRANDREAQRAIRQRTKDHIEQLERRIAELTSVNDTSARLRDALQRVEELEQEVAMLRAQLGHPGGSMGATETAGEFLLRHSLTRSPVSPIKWSVRAVDFSFFAVSDSPSITPIPPSPGNHLSALGRPSRPSFTRGPTSVSSTSHHPPVQQSDHWQSSSAYGAAVAQGIPGGPGGRAAEVSQSSGAVQWSPHPHQTGPAMPAPPAGAGGGYHPAEANMSSVNYGYMLDSTGQPLPYQPNSQPMGYSTSTSPHPPPNFQGQHLGGHVTPGQQYSQYAAQQPYGTDQGQPHSPHGGLPIMTRPSADQPPFYHHT